MIPSPRVNHLAVGPGLPPSASGGSAPRPGALGLHFAQDTRFGVVWRGVRADGCHPRGHASGDPLRKGREARPYSYWPSARVGVPPEVFDSTSCLAKTADHPGRPPDGLFPGGHLACATGPEGDTRRLFRAVRLMARRARP